MTRDPLLRRPRRIRNGLKLRLAEQLAEDVDKDFVQVRRIHTDHVRVHLQTVTQLLGIEVRIRRPNGPAVLEQGGNRTVRIQRLTSSTSAGTLRSATPLPDTRRARAGSLEEAHVTKTLERLDSTTQAISDRKPDDLGTVGAVLRGSRAFGRRMRTSIPSSCVTVCRCTRT